MRRHATLLLALLLAGALVVVPGCRTQMVTVQSGETIICTYGEIVSETIEEIEVPANEVAEHGVTTEVVTCELHTKLASLYEAALQAIEDGDFEAAERALAEIVESDASYRDTSSLIADVRTRTGSAENGGAGGTDTPSGGGGTTAPGGSTTPPGGGVLDPDDDTPVGPIANLTGYIPDRLPGFVGQRIYSAPFNLFRDYLPESSGDIIQLSVEVDQLKDAQMAQRRIDERVKTTYPVAGEAVRVGSLDAYFGTRQDYAVIAVVDGSVLLIMEVATRSGSPQSHKGVLLEVARAATGQ